MGGKTGRFETWNGRGYRRPRLLPLLILLALEAAKIGGETWGKVFHCSPTHRYSGGWMKEGSEK